MPCNSFTFAVRVGCEEYFVCIFGFFFKLFYKVSFTAYIYIVGLEIIVDIYAESAFRQIADMSDRCHDLISGAEIAFNSRHFTGRLKNNEICHLYYSFRFLYFYVAACKGKN